MFLFFLIDLIICYVGLLNVMYNVMYVQYSDCLVKHIMNHYESFASSGLPMFYVILTSSGYCNKLQPATKHVCPSFIYQLCPLYSTLIV